MLGPRGIITPHPSREEKSEAQKYMGPSVYKETRKEEEEHVGIIELMMYTDSVHINIMVVSSYDIIRTV